MSQVAKTHRPSKDEEDEAPTPEPQESETAAAVEAVLDEIDEVLEENAETFVANYIQKGGELQVSARTLRAYRQRHEIADLLIGIERELAGCRRQMTAYRYPRTWKSRLKTSLAWWRA